MSMLYLEDFLELIEQLPGELRDRFTEMRLLDLAVQNGLDDNNKKLKDLFRSANLMPADERQRRHREIKQNYGKILENSDEKVSLANAMYDLVERYQRKLDIEVGKFKIELEADNPGITEELESKVREAEMSRKNHRKDRKRNRSRCSGILSSVTHDNRAVSVSVIDGMTSSTGGSALSSVANASPLVNGVSPYAKAARYATGTDSRRLSPAAGFRPTGNARVSTSSMLSASFPNLSTAADTPSSLSSSMSGVGTWTQGAPPPTPTTPMSTGGPPMPNFGGAVESRHGRQRKLTSRVQEMLKETMQRHQQRFNISAGSSGASTSTTVPLNVTSSTEDTDSDEEDDEDSTDDKRTWCICNQSSYGDMVACDNQRCPFEWFHYNCVGITGPPKGKWYCPHCTETMKRRSTQQQTPATTAVVAATLPVNVTAATPSGSFMTSLPPGGGALPPF